MKEEKREVQYVHYIYIYFARETEGRKKDISWLPNELIQTYKKHSTTIWSQGNRVEWETSYVSLLAEEV